MKRFRKKRAAVRRFNMVEIALALAVLTLGISSILALLPVGVNAGKLAIAENNIGDAASYTAGVYRAYIMNSILKHYDPDTDTWTAAEKTFPDWYTALVKPDGSDTDGIDWANKPKLEVGGEKTNLRRHSDTILCYEQTTVDADGNELVDFSAVVRVWSFTRKFSVVYYPGIQNPGMTYRYIPCISSLLDNVGLRLFFELSWPVNVDWAEREKRTFVMDLGNQQVTLYTIH